MIVSQRLTDVKDWTSDTIVWSPCITAMNFGKSDFKRHQKKIKVSESSRNEPLHLYYVSAVKRKNITLLFGNCSTRFIFAYSGGIKKEL